MIADYPTSSTFIQICSIYPGESCAWWILARSAIPPFTTRQPTQAIPRRSAIIRDPRLKPNLIMPKASIPSHEITRMVRNITKTRGHDISTLQQNLKCEIRYRSEDNKFPHFHHRSHSIYTHTEKQRRPISTAPAASSTQ